MITLDGRTLPDEGNLWWEDEIDWTPVDQIVTWSTTGAVLLDVSTKQAGRPITLVGNESSAWITRETALTLQAWAAIPGKEMELSIHGQLFTVKFRYDDKKPIEVEPIVRMSPPSNNHYCTLKTIKLMAV